MFRTSLRLLVAGMLLLLAGCGGAKGPPPALDAQATVDGHTVKLAITLQNFELGKQGHLHLYLDSNSTPVTLMTPKYTLPEVSSGHHQFRLELTDPKHTPIGVEKSIPFDVP